MYMKNSKKHYQNYPSEHMHIDKKTTQVSYFNLMCGDFFFFFKIEPMTFSWAPPIHTQTRKYISLTWIKAQYKIPVVYQLQLDPTFFNLFQIKLNDIFSYNKLIWYL